ncbi:hypothetical protein BT67DRAFT_7827 [Trichocladium antarcticum]|uniref:Extracellular membrane protein CFEM domain-containing protein n=1 Tax=Trichocladium antarcticum TaxID=1450529 RepID=A0AAN6USH1_9PEZI|nr:hypothetical protein BT67DRAFT_7827 [Trichocladium antarcticum]
MGPKRNRGGVLFCSGAVNPSQVPPRQGPNKKTTDLNGSPSPASAAPRDPRGCEPGTCSWPFSYLLALPFGSLCRLSFAGLSRSKTFLYTLSCCLPRTQPRCSSKKPCRTEAVEKKPLPPVPPPASAACGFPAAMASSASLPSPDPVAFLMSLPECARNCMLAAAKTVIAAGGAPSGDVCAPQDAAVAEAVASCISTACTIREAL